MSPDKTKLRDKSSGDGITSYRITSYLTLSQSTASKKDGTEDEAPASMFNDLFNEGVLVATDTDPVSGKKSKKGGKKAKEVKRAISPVERIKNNVANIKEMIVNTVMYPFSIFAYYLDMILENIALITQNMGAIMALAYKAVVKQVKESSVFQGEEIYEPDYSQEEDEEDDEDGDDDSITIKKETREGEYSQYDASGNKKISFLDLHELNIIFTDNKGNALFHFDIRKTQSYRPSPMVIDPIATKAAIEAIKECAERAASIPPAMEGPYANIPLSTVLSTIEENDLQAFLRYVKIYPGNYVGRNLKISETFATWIVYGAPSPQI